MNIVFKMFPLDITKKKKETLALYLTWGFAESPNIGILVLLWGCIDTHAHITKCMHMYNHGDAHEKPCKFLTYMIPSLSLTVSL